MARLHLIIGPVGAGKSTFALELAKRHSAVRFNLDEWMTDLFTRDRPDSGVIEWYRERSTRCVDLIWKSVRRVLEANTDVVLEIGLILRGDRERLYRKVDKEKIDLAVYVVDAPREERRERVAQRNRSRGETFSMVVPPQIFEMASDMWEPPDDEERRERSPQFFGSAE